MDANMSTALKISAWKSWRPAEYFHEYFSHQVEPDEQAAIPFQVEFLRRAGRAFPRALETVVGVAFISGKFLQWQATDQIVAAVVLLGIAWLLFRAG